MLPLLRGWRNSARDLVEFFSGQQSLSWASMYRYTREKQRDTVSSNSRFQTVLFQQYSPNLSTSADVPGQDEGWRGCDLDATG